MFPILSFPKNNRPGDDGSIGPIGGTRMPDAITPHTCIKSSADYELALILKEIRFITDQVSAVYLWLPHILIQHLI